MNSPGTQRYDLKNLADFAFSFVSIALKKMNSIQFNFQV